MVQVNCSCCEFILWYIYTILTEEVGHVRSANKINLLNCIFWIPAVSTCVFQDGGLRVEVAVKGRTI